MTKLSVKSMRMALGCVRSCRPAALEALRTNPTSSAAKQLKLALHHPFPIQRRNLHTSSPLIEADVGSPSDHSGWRSSKTRESLRRKAVKTVLLVKKPEDERTRQAMLLVLDHLLSSDLPTEPLQLLLERPAYEDLCQYSPSKMASWTSPSPHSRHGQISILEDTPPSLRTEDPHSSTAQPAIDLVITIGGDGTVLHVSSLFDRPGVVPPVLAFSMGNLGFLLPFHIESYAKTLDTVLAAPEGAGYSVLNRMRIACGVYDQGGKELDCLAKRGGGGWQVMNEVALHRGRYPHLSIVDAFVNGQHLTEAVADGLILATPTGSTAYSLSAGGPIAHPSVNSFLLTPIAPRSLSFRTVLLPSEAEVTLQISKQSRAPSELSIDGREVCILNPGDYVQIKQSAYPVPCITRAEKGDDWVADINQLLQFNAGFKNKSLWQRHTTS